MTIWAIIPVKKLSQSKSRLAPYLSQFERGELIQDLLHRLLQQLHDVPQVDEIVVVSRDDVAARIAERNHAYVVAENEGNGLNGAVQVGYTFASENGASSVLILPSDLPFVDAEDVAMLWGETAVSPHNATICSDRHLEGTNALLLPANLPFKFQYGLNSYQKHLAEAARLQLQMQTAYIPSLQFDLDTLRDWELYKNQQFICSPSD